VVLDVMIVGVALVAGVPPIVMAALAIVVLAPILPASLAVAVGVAISVRRLGGEAGPVAERVFLQAVAAELRAGATLRAALIDAADRVPELGLEGWVRAAVAGQPLTELSGRLRDHLAVTGRATAAAVEFAANAGGATPALFAGLAQQADDAIALRRERAAASAQARLSAAVVAGAPMVVLGWLGAQGGLETLLSDGPGRVLLGVGGALELIGVVVTVVMLTRAEA
jgi:Flp pilus assembly protein TadB